MSKQNEEPVVTLTLSEAKAIDLVINVAIRGEYAPKNMTNICKPLSDAIAKAEYHKQLEEVNRYNCKRLKEILAPFETTTFTVTAEGKREVKKYIFSHEVRAELEGLVLSGELAVDLVEVMLTGAYLVLTANTTPLDVIEAVTKMGVVLNG